MIHLGGAVEETCFPAEQSQPAGHLPPQVLLGHPLLRPGKRRAPQLRLCAGRRYLCSKVKLRYVIISKQ